MSQYLHSLTESTLVDLSSISSRRLRAQANGLVAISLDQIHEGADKAEGIRVILYWGEIQTMSLSGSFSGRGAEEAEVFILSVHELGKHNGLH